MNNQSSSQARNEWKGLFYLPSVHRTTTVLSGIFLSRKNGHERNNDDDDDDDDDDK